MPAAFSIPPRYIFLLLREVLVVVSLCAVEGIRGQSAFLNSSWLNPEFLKMLFNVPFGRSLP